jgi:hypothetical protein
VAGSGHRPATVVAETVRAAYAVAGLALGALWLLAWLGSVPGGAPEGSQRRTDGRAGPDPYLIRALAVP